MVDLRRASDAAPHEPFLKTKLFVPRVRLGNLARPRLYALLDQGFARKLTLLSAPAGSGKSTLLSEWLAAGSRRPLLSWLSLEEADNHPARFWLYVAEAFAQLQPGLGEGALTLLRSAQSVSPEAVVRTLTNDLADLAEEAVLVLDDYHLITADPVHQSVALFLEHLPPQIHLAITTRVDPPLPLARLRVRGELTEIRLAELKFTPEEAAALFGKVLGLGLTPRQVALLGERTEGWIAGLQLAALSLQGLSDAHVAEFVESFVGSHQYVVDFLVEEVLQHQPAAIQAFLLETSVLDRLSGPLCDAVTGGTDGRAILEHLERRNLFLVALDHQRQWYRYHHLFAEAVRGHLHRQRPSDVERLHRQASLWYEANGLVEPAVDHALAAGDNQRALSLVSATAEQVWHRGESGLLRRWFEALPDRLVRSHPELASSIAWALLTSGQTDIADSLLQAAEGALVGQGDPSLELLGHIAATRAHVVRLRMQFADSVALSGRAQALLPTASSAGRAWATFNLGALSQWSGQVDAAIATYSEACSLFDGLGDLYGFLRTTVWRAELLADTGRLDEALSDCRAALAQADQLGQADSPVAAVAHIGIGELLYERGDYAEAARHLSTAETLALRGGLLDAYWLALLPIALLRQAMGDSAAALACLDEADQLTTKVEWALAYSVACRARLLLAQGEWEQAGRLVPRLKALASDGGQPMLWAALSLSQIYLSQGLAGEALACLEPFGQGAQGGSIAWLSRQALALEAAGERGRALGVLGRALALAAPGEMGAAFVELGRPMVDLLAVGLPGWEGAVGAHARRVLERVGVGVGPGAVPGVGPGSGARSGPGTGPTVALVEPLSPREMEVLVLLAEGASNARIAQVLVVTEHTAKKHVGNLLAKLGAENRTQAVARARALGVL